MRCRLEIFSARFSSTGGMRLQLNQASSNVLRNSSLFVFVISQAFHLSNCSEVKCVERREFISSQNVCIVLASTPSRSNAIFSFGASKVRFVLGCPLP